GCSRRRIAVSVVAATVIRLKAKDSAAFVRRLLYGRVRFRVLRDSPEGRSVLGNQVQLRAAPIWEARVRKHVDAGIPESTEGAGPLARPIGDLDVEGGRRRHLVRPSPASLQRRTERWRPWRAYGAMLLPLDGAVVNTAHRRSGGVALSM